MTWSAVATLLVGLLVRALVGWRIDEEAEVDGIDFAEHGETAYDLTATPTGRLTRNVGVTQLTGASRDRNT
jgi:Amt family ammonium transporter